MMSSPEVVSDFHHTRSVVPSEAAINVGLCAEVPGDLDKSTGVLHAASLTMLSGAEVVLVRGGLEPSAAVGLGVSVAAEVPGVFGKLLVLVHDEANTIIMATKAAIIPTFRI